MTTVQFSRQEVARILRNARLFQAADEAMRDLPDPVDFDHVEAWGFRHGITRDGLVSRMGGSP